MPATKRTKELDDMFWAFFKIHALVYTASPHDPVLTRTTARQLFQRGVEIGKSLATKERQAK